MPRKVPAKGNQHVIRFGNGWAVKKSSDRDFFTITEKQSDAIKVARKLAKDQKTELYIHGKDGSIRSSESYEERKTTTRRPAIKKKK